MTFVRVIPCLDVKNGRVVKGKRFVDLDDVGDPVELAIRYEQQGADELAVLDITATVDGRTTTIDLVRKIAESVSVPITVGGGVRTIEDFEKLLATGAAKVAVNSAAVRNPELIRDAADTFGRQAVVVAIDARRKCDKDAGWWEVVTHGGQFPTGMDALEWSERVEKLGAGELLVTSVDADGTRGGYDNDLNFAIASRVGIPLVASGGAGRLSDLKDAVVIGHASAVLAASIFHFNQYSVSDVKKYLKSFGIPVRIEEGL